MGATASRRSAVHTFRAAGSVRHRHRAGFRPRAQRSPDCNTAKTRRPGDPSSSDGPHHESGHVGGTRSIRALLLRRGDAQVRNRAGCFACERDRATRRVGHGRRGNLQPPAASATLARTSRVAGDQRFPCRAGAGDFSVRLRAEIRDRGRSRARSREWRNTQGSTRSGVPAAVPDAFRGHRARRSVEYRRTFLDKTRLVSRCTLLRIAAQNGGGHSSCDAVVATRVLQRR
jgi:hypothetical protein